MKRKQPSSQGENTNKKKKMRKGNVQEAEPFLINTKTPSEEIKSHTISKIDTEEDNRAWEQNVRPQRVREFVIFGLLSLLHSGLAQYFHDVHSAPGYAVLACTSFGIASYASCSKTERSFQRVWWVILMMFEMSRILAIAFFVDCSSNFIGSTCNQLRHKKYPMRWAMDAVGLLTLASSLPSSTFRLIAVIEMGWVCLAIRHVEPSNLAEQGVVAEVILGLLLVMMCAYNQLRSNEIMSKTIYYRERTDKIVNHRIKNILADTYSTLLLYPKGLANLQDLQRSAKSVQRASRSIQNSLNLSQLLNPEFHGTNSETSPDQNTREVKLGGWIREHGPSRPFEIFATGCDIAEGFIIHEILAAELFLDLALDNAALHGGGDTRVDCVFDGQKMLIDVNNSIADTKDVPAKNNSKQKKDVLHHREFSTCLGNHDIQLVCSKRQIPFQSSTRDDNRWHSSIRVSAVRMSDTRVEIGAQTIDTTARIPHNLRVVVLDDVKMIVRLCKMQLQTQMHARVEAYHVDTLAAYDKFTNETIPANMQGWDIVILDQTLDMKCGVVKRGTELMDMLRESSACLIMHSGNSDTRDCERYSDHGCHGVVGKGEVFVEKVSQIYLEYISQRV